MSGEAKHPEPDRTQQGNPRSPRTRHRPSLFSYLLVLFLAAFVLLLMSYFMQQRRNDQAVINGLQQNISAMQATQHVSQQNQELLSQNRDLQETIDALRGQVESLESDLEEQTRIGTQLAGDKARLEQELTARQEQTDGQLARQEQTILALDWLWRIEREYFKGRYSSARTLIRDFEQTGLVDALPQQSLVDPEYRTPRAQYDSIYDALF